MTITTDHPDKLGFRQFARGDQLVTQLAVQDITHIDSSGPLVAYKYDNIVTMDMKADGITYGFEDDPLIDAAGVASWTSVTVEPVTKDSADWRAGLLDKQSPAYNFAYSRYKDDIANPGSVDLKFATSALAEEAARARVDKWLDQTDFEFSIIGAPMLTGLSLMTPGGSGGVGLLERAFPTLFGRTILPAGNAGVRFAMREAAKNGDALLLERGVTDPGLRRSILDSGFNPAILGDASPTTMTRFDKLFQGSLDAGKAFRGRLGNLSTRARTIEQAVELDRLGLTPRFEAKVFLESGSTRFVDVAGLNAARKPVSYLQLYRETQIGTIPLREVNAANDIFSATGIRPTMIRTGP